MYRPGSSAAPSAPPIPSSSPSPSPSPSTWRWQEQEQQQQQQHPPFAYPYPAAPPSSSAPPSLYATPAPAPYSQPYTAQPWGAPPPPPPAAYLSPIGDASYPPLSYGAPPPFYAQSLFPPGTDPEIIQAFQGADRDGSGLIDDNELQRTLSISHFFSLRTARLMVHLYGSKNSTQLGPKEFATLWKALKDWKGIFERFDRDRSGSIDKGEMREALLSLGYSVSPPILDCLLQKYDRTGQSKAMDYDSFVQSGLIVKGLTEKFKEQDTQLKGSATLSYQTFMLMVLPFIVA